MLIGPWILRLFFVEVVGAGGMELCCLMQGFGF